MASPALPRPEFFSAPENFTTKKEANRPRRSIVPRPPAKHGNVRCLSHAKRVSFRETRSESLTMSRLYDTSKSESYFRQVFEVQDKIGEGSFAEVYRARDKERGGYYAIKQSHQFRKNVDRKRQMEEVKKHEAIPPHPNCLRYIGAWEEGERLYLQTELCQKSLSEYCEENHDIPEKLVWNYLVDLLRALKHLHDRDLVHLDVKPENILISSHGILKLGDFGLVHDLHDSKELAPIDGDGKYVAPEVLNGEVYSKAADVFSLGITILEVAVDLVVPSSDKLFWKLRNGQLPDELIEKAALSADLVDIIRKMLKPVPCDRPSIDMLLFHPAVRKVAWKREKVVDFYDKYDRVKAKATTVLHYIVANLVIVFWGVWSWITHPEVWLNPRGWRRSSVASASTDDFSDASNFDVNLRDDSVLGGSSASTAEAVGHNGTPPNVRASCAQPSPVMKSHSTRMSAHMFSPRNLGLGGSAFTSTPMKEGPREPNDFSTPQLTPVAQHQTPLTQGSGSVRRRLNWDEANFAAASTPNPAISNTASKSTSSYGMTGRNLFPRSPADVSADEEEDDAGGGRPGPSGVVVREDEAENGSPKLRQKNKAKHLVPGGASPAGKLPVKKRLKTTNNRLAALRREEAVSVDSGGGDSGAVKDLSKQFDASSDSD